MFALFKHSFIQSPKKKELILLIPLVLIRQAKGGKELTHHNELWILLQNLLHNQLQQIGTESSIQEQLDHIILTMLVDYKVKGNITNQIPLQIMQTTLISVLSFTN